MKESVGPVTVLPMKEKKAANHEIRDLKPEGLWFSFEKISKIPRCSGNEAGVIQFIQEKAIANGLASRMDPAGNLLIRIPASKGREKEPSLCIQSHVDMVCEKNSDKEHDFSTDPLELMVQGDYVYASGTTLGADNGIGAASMIALMDEDHSHPELELLFTVDEERGLRGALGLDGGLLKSNYLINTDTEEDGAFYIGCAGGADSIIRLPAGEKINDFQSFLEISIRGLKGGHSGIDIHRHRANAVYTLATILGNLALRMPTGIVRFDGGDKHNAIPREASAVIGVSDLRGAEEILNLNYGIFLEQFGVIETEATMETRNVEPQEHFDSADTERILGLISSIHHGPIHHSPEIPELVETSNNLASIATLDRGFQITLSSRSSITSVLEPIRNRFELLARLAGGTLERGPVYPGWKPDPESRFLKQATEAYRDLFQKEPSIRAIHAGLETGVIKDRYPGMDMISIGPEIQFPHSPTERVEIDSVKRYYDLLLEIMRRGAPQ